MRRRRVVRREPIFCSTNSRQPAIPDSRWPHHGLDDNGRRLGRGRPPLFSSFPEEDTVFLMICRAAKKKDKLLLSEKSPLTHDGIGRGAVFVWHTPEAATGHGSLDADSGDEREKE